MFCFNKQDLRPYILWETSGFPRMTIFAPHQTIYMSSYEPPLASYIVTFFLNNNYSS